MRPSVCLAFALALGVAPAAAATQVVRTVPLDGSLGTPDGITIGPDGNVYVADFGGGQGTRVLRVDAHGRVTTFADGFKAPDGLAFDRHGTLHVSSFNGGTIHRVAPDGTVTPFAAGLDHPSGLAFDSTGALYVANFGNFDGTTVSRVTPDGTVTTFARGFSAPLGVAFGPDGLLYVSSYTTGSIHRIDASGTTSLFAQAPNAPISQLQYLAFDAAGTLLSPSLGRNRVYAIDRTGKVRVHAGSGIAGYGDGDASQARLHTPNSIAIRGDTVWITEFQSGRLRRIEPVPTRQAGPALARARLEAERLTSDSATFVITQRWRGGRTDSLGTLTMTRRSAQGRLTFVQAWNAGAVQSRDTLQVDARTLRPIARASGPATRRIQSRFERGRVIAGTDTMVIDSSAIAYDGTGLELAIAALRFDGTPRTSLPFFVGAQRGVVPGEVTASASNADGEPGWAVDVGYPNAMVHVRVAERGRRILALTHDYGASALHFTRLADAPPPGARLTPPFRIVAHEYAFTKPARLPSGLVTLRLVNDGREPHYFSIMRADSGKGAQDFLAWRTSRTPRPSWLTPVGGHGTIAPGDSLGLTLRLKPGTYVVFCGYPSPDGSFHFTKGMLGEIVVDNTPATRVNAPTTVATVTLQEFGVSAPPTLRSGSNTVRVVNAGRQLHQLLVARLPDGVTPEQELAWFTGGFRGDRPGLPAGGVIQLPAGDTVWVTTTWKPGRYLLFCAVAVAGGQAHHALGMRTVVDVRD